MSDSTGPGGARAALYTDYHPRWYRRRVSTYWWLGRRSYLLFILRELSSVAVAFSVVFTLGLLRALCNGPEVWADFQRIAANPLVIAMNAIAFLFLLLHTITWFNLAPKAMPVRLGGRRIPDFWLAAPNFVVWLFVSAAIFWLLGRS